MDQKPLDFSASRGAAAGDAAALSINIATTRSFWRMAPKATRPPPRHRRLRDFVMSGDFVIGTIVS